jgi:hypothetical protein
LNGWLCTCNDIVVVEGKPDRYECVLFQDMIARGTDSLTAFADEIVNYNDVLYGDQRCTLAHPHTRNSRLRERSLQCTDSLLEYSSNRVCRNVLNLYRLVMELFSSRARSFCSTWGDFARSINSGFKIRLSVRSNVLNSDTI